MNYKFIKCKEVKNLKAGTLLELAGEVYFVASYQNHTELHVITLKGKFEKFYTKKLREGNLGYTQVGEMKDLSITIEFDNHQKVACVQQAKIGSIIKWDEELYMYLGRSDIGLNILLDLSSGIIHPNVAFKVEGFDGTLNVALLTDPDRSKVKFKLKGEK